MPKKRCPGCRARNKGLTFKCAQCGAEGCPKCLREVPGAQWAERWACMGECADAVEVRAVFSPPTEGPSEGAVARLTHAMRQAGTSARAAGEKLSTMRQLIDEEARLSRREAARRALVRSRRFERAERRRRKK